jgi:hypothetical protein
MYSDRAVQAAEARLLTAPAFRPTYPQGIPAYTIDDTAGYTNDLRAAVDEKGVLLRRLSPEEQTFIAATLLRISLDFRYFAERFVTIDAEGYGTRPLFPLWESQAFVLQILGDLEWQREQAGHPDGLLLNILKARQLGISTLAEALIAHRVLTRGRVRALVGADVEDQAGYLFRMVDRLYQALPWFLKLQRVNFVKNREMVFNNQSYVKTAWGKSTRGALQSVTGTEGSKGAIGRGQTFGTVHISELATWDNPEQLDSSLLPAIPIAPSTLVLFESTAEVAGDWWHTHWLAAAAGEGRFTNVFIPWYAERAKYSLPAPLDWTPTSHTLQHARKCEHDAPLTLGHATTLHRDQLYWYERTRSYYQKKGELSKFLREYASDAIECFQYSGRAIFTLEQLEAIDAAGSRRGRPIDVWAVEPAREIAELRRLPAADASRPDRRPLPPLAPRLPLSTLATAAEAYPVPPGYGFRRLSPSDLQALPSLTSSVLAIWEYPRPRGRRRYVMGVDVAEGLALDYSVITVVRLPTIEEPAEDVAQYISNTVDTKQLAFICDAIGRFYMDEDGIEALAAIETGGPGLATQDTLQLHLGYAHFYVWEYADAANPDRRFSTKLGWVTSTRTRPILVTSFHDAITTIDPIGGLPDFVLNSPSTRAELRHFVSATGRTADAEHARGQHDDCIFSAAIGYYVAWRLAGGETEPIAERRRRRTALQQQQAGDDAQPLRDYRNSDATAEEADRAQEEDDEFADALAGDAGLYFASSGDARNRVD